LLVTVVGANELPYMCKASEHMVQVAFLRVVSTLNGDQSHTL